MQHINKMLAAARPHVPALMCSICIFLSTGPSGLSMVIHLFNFMQAGEFPSAALGKKKKSNYGK